jgi:surfeit locus 1 family protein
MVRMGGKRRASADFRNGGHGVAGKFVLPTLGMLIFAAIFSVLGFWQLERADEKRALQAEYDRRATQTPVQLGSAIRPAEALQFFRIEASGFYENDYQVLLDNRVHQGAPGYHAVTALRIAGGDTRVLVNRGWIPLGADRAHPPSTTPPRGRVTVSGVGVVPRVGFSLGEPDSLTRDAPTVWQQLDLARYASGSGFLLQPIVILLDPDSSAGGYVRDWSRLDTGIAVHQGYAFQWFMLAATVVVLYLVWALRASARRKRGDAV